MGTVRKDNLSSLSSSSKLKDLCSGRLYALLQPTAKDVIALLRNFPEGVRQSPNFVLHHCHTRKAKRHGKNFFGNSVSLFSMSANGPMQSPFSASAPPAPKKQSAPKSSMSTGKIVLIVVVVLLCFPLIIWLLILLVVSGAVVASYLFSWVGFAIVLMVGIFVLFKDKDL